ncbi:transcription factor bHLH168-like isoform X2 [Ipomoea triloba]|uniref:transcription factor bHLH168-like isoform X2 n=1 Tax=Ipomoea triloba TaxID=35885 RepID=UPI00125E7262|nr:transcription factor bHLH168-like isoform X2 [Ipomoea triloba]
MEDLVENGDLMDMMEEKMRIISSTGGVSEKPDRKTVERKRRIHMKYLCGKLVSLIPPHHFYPSKESVSQQDQLDQAATYIKALRERVEKLEKMKKKMSWGEEEEEGEEEEKSATTAAGCTLLKSPVIEVRDLGSTLEVVLMSATNKPNLMLHQLIKIVEEEGAQVETASFSTVGDKVFHTLHAQVKVARLGMETSRVYGRLKQLIT